MVYLKQPPSFADTQKPYHVYALHKCLYNLKQATWAWIQQLSSTLLALGFRRLKTDPSLFIYCTNDILLYMLVYFDDIIITRNNFGGINRVFHSVCKSFAVQDMGPLTYFLSIKVQRYGCDLLLSQRKYIMHLLDHAKLS